MAQIDGPSGLQFRSYFSILLAATINRRGRDADERTAFMTIRQPGTHHRTIAEQYSQILPPRRLRRHYIFGTMRGKTPAFAV